MEVIPLQPVAAQSLQVLLSNQPTTITLRQLSTGLFMDLQVGTKEIVGLVICQNQNFIVRDTYLGFLGDLAFIDNTGQGRDPFYTGLGSDFSLIYYSPADLGLPSS